jgi:hypothetical protein
VADRGDRLIDAVEDGSVEEAWTRHSNLRYCLQPGHLRWTLRIGVIMGILYTVVNQGDLILSGRAGALIWVKIPLNFIAPFLVANLGLIGSRRGREGSA